MADEEEEEEVVVVLAVVVTVVEGVGFEVVDDIVADAAVGADERPVMPRTSQLDASSPHVNFTKAPIPGTHRDPRSRLSPTVSVATRTKPFLHLDAIHATTVSILVVPPLWNRLSYSSSPSRATQPTRGQYAVVSSRLAVCFVPAGIPEAKKPKAPVP